MSQLACYDWCSAARAAEHPDELEPIDRALTATGLAAQITQLVDRMDSAL